jgi:hypothetical protein
VVPLVSTSILTVRSRETSSNLASALATSASTSTTAVCFSSSTFLISLRALVASTLAVSLTSLSSFSISVCHRFAAWITSLSASSKAFLIPSAIFAVLGRMSTKY